MSKNVKLSLALVAVALVGLGIALTASRDDGTAAETGGASVDRLVRPDSQRLSESTDGKATFVEFLDFECEACGAAYPAIEEMREEYGDRITFVVRHFPLHRNSESAARAAEAAAEQGKFEEMYRRLFDTQRSWGEKSTSQEEVFFAFAEDLGLDMDRFRRVYEDPETIAKVRRDKADGEALGVDGTPTFFLNGEKLEVRSLGEIEQSIDDALGR